MSSSYSQLFSIDVEHAFVGATARLPLRCVLTPQTEQWLRRSDLLMRPHRNGVAVFCEEGRRRLLLEGLGKDDAPPLAFKFFPMDPLFSRYTLPALQRQDKLLYFCSGAAVDEGSGRWRMHAGEYADDGRQFDIGEPALARHLDRKDALSRPAFVVEIDPADQLAGQADTGAGVAYYLRFSTRRSIWKYYFVSQADEAEIAIVDLDGEVRFVAGDPEQLPGNRRALVFVSEMEIEMRQRHAQRFQLREQSGMGERVLIKRLPNADAGRVTQELVGSKATLVSEIYIN